MNERDAIGYSNVLQLELHSLVLHVTAVEKLSDRPSEQLLGGVEPLFGLALVGGHGCRVIESRKLGVIDSTSVVV